MCTGPGLMDSDPIIQFPQLPRQTPQAGPGVEWGSEPSPPGPAPLTNSVGGCPQPSKPPLKAFTQWGSCFGVRYLDLPAVCPE